MVSSSLLDAATVSYTGSFLNDNDVKLTTFTVASASTVTFQSYSYAGGKNGSGNTISSGGFDPVIDLFNSAGTLINENDDGTPSQVPADPTTLQNFDFYLQMSLNPGTYTVAVTQFDNFANGPSLSNGFYETSPTFTSGFGCSNGSFCDVTGANRTANWSFDISTTPASTATPEPAATALMIAGLGAIGIVRKRLMKP